MVKTLQKTISLIEQALRSCPQDVLSLDVRKYLLLAIKEAQYASNRKMKKVKSALELAQDKGKSFNNSWWSEIQENVRKMAKEEAEKIKDNKEKTPEESE